MCVGWEMTIRDFYLPPEKISKLMVGKRNMKEDRLHALPPLHHLHSISNLNAMLLCHQNLSKSALGFKNTQTEDMKHNCPRNAIRNILPWYRKVLSRTKERLMPQTPLTKGPHLCHSVFHYDWGSKTTHFTSV